MGAFRTCDVYALVASDSDISSVKISRPLEHCVHFADISIVAVVFVVGIFDDR